MQCQADKTILLKPGYKVMLLWKLSWRFEEWNIRNVFRTVIVDFPEIGEIGLKRETWNKRLTRGRLVGSRKQHPVVAMYTITCHKSQGRTLPAVVVHCSKEFYPGWLMLLVPVWRAVKTYRSLVLKDLIYYTPWRSHKRLQGSSWTRHR